MALRTLIIRPGAIGDCILSLPAMEALRSSYTEVWVAGQNVPLVRFADQVDSIAATGLDLLGLPETGPHSPLVERLRSFDRIVSWYGTQREEFREAVREMPFEFHAALPPPGNTLHAADFFCRQAGGAVPAMPRISCPSTRAGFAVIHPFSGSPRKNWPLDRFRELANRIGRELPVRWCAGPEEPLDQAVRCENLYELACWLASANVFIGNDSGISHLAAAAGTPVVALFGPTDPSVWAPRGPAVRVVARRSLDEIAVEEVSAAVWDLTC